MKFAIINPIQEIISNFRKNSFDNKKLAESNLNHYFPNRNLLFTSIIGVFTETIAYLNSLKLKYTTYKPCWDITSNFANAVQNVMSLNNAMKVTLATSFIDWTKSDIVKYMVEKNIQYELTRICYEPQIDVEDYLPCKVCQTCIERENAGMENNICDINKYKIGQ